MLQLLNQLVDKSPMNLYVTYHRKKEVSLNLKKILRINIISLDISNENGKIRCGIFQTHDTLPFDLRVGNIFKFNWWKENFTFWRFSYRPVFIISLYFSSIITDHIKLRQRVVEFKCTFISHSMNSFPIFHEQFIIEKQCNLIVEALNLFLQ